MNIGNAFQGSNQNRFASAAVRVSVEPRRLADRAARLRRELLDHHFRRRDLRKVLLLQRGKFGVLLMD